MMKWRIAISSQEANNHNERQGLLRMGGDWYALSLPHQRKRSGICADLGGNREVSVVPLVPKYAFQDAEYSVTLTIIHFPGASPSQSRLLFNQSATSHQKTGSEDIRNIKTWQWKVSRRSDKNAGSKAAVLLLHTFYCGIMRFAACFEDWFLHLQVCFAKMNV